jgi:hypothetical protein
VTADDKDEGDSPDGFSWNLRPSAAEPPPPALVEPPRPALVEPPPTQPLAAVDIPTQAIERPPAPAPAEAPPVWDPFATQSGPIAQPPVSSVDLPTETYTVEPWMPAPPPAPAAEPLETVAYVPPVPSIPFQHAAQHPAHADPHDPTSAIDSLFGDHQFQEYEEVGLLPIIPTTTGAADDRYYAAPVVERAPLSSTQKALLWAAGGLVAALALVLLFMLGTKLGAASATSATSTAPSVAATAKPTTTANGLAAPGVQLWSALKGGECIQPFTSAWAATFTVVDCSAPHDAQAIVKGSLTDASGAAYPTGAQFSQKIMPLCSARTALNYSAAAKDDDIQLSFTYPPNQDAWSSGDRTYYCFVSRESGGNLPGDLAVRKG